MKLLEGRNAVVTGAATPRGIGFATARLFAAHGARVALVDVDAAALAAAAATLGPAHRHYVCDVRDRAACGAVVDAAARELGGLDLLVNNAGLVHGTPLDDIGAAEWSQVIDVNLRGNFHMAQAAVPHLRARGGGAIVCVSSIAGQVGGGVFGTAHYAAAKSGIFGLAKALARELAPDRIRANAVAPGPIDNDFTHGRMTDAHKARIAEGVPLRRLGTPEDVANAILFLASDMAAWITGTVLDVNGGLHIH